MAATATKRKEPQLSEEVKELYARCWGIANEKLPKFGIDASFLQKIKDPEEVSRESVKSSKVYRGIAETEQALSSIFATKNNLPETIRKDEKLVSFISGYIKKNFGKDLVVQITEVGNIIATDSRATVSLKEGMETLHDIYELSHEIGHFDEPFAKKLKEIDSMVFPILKETTKSGAANFWSKLTGVNSQIIVDELNFQSSAYNFTNAAVFLIQLYDTTLYKPADEKTKENLEFCRFMLDKDLRRAFYRYQEGRANFAVVGLLDSDDDVIKTYAALEFLYQVTHPTPQYFSERSDKLFADQARKIEGFKSYYTLQKRLGGALREFERVCTENGWVPGVDINGKLVGIDTKNLKMFEVDAEKLKAGITNIEELTEKAPKLPKKMD